MVAGGDRALLEVQIVVEVSVGESFVRCGCVVSSSYKGWEVEWESILR